MLLPSFFVLVGLISSSSYFGWVASAPAAAAGATVINDETAKVIKEVLDKHPVVDGHNDFPYWLKLAHQNQLREVDFNSDLSNETHTDLPRMRKGGVGGQFWSAFARCRTQFKDAPKIFQEQIDVVKRLVAKNKDDMVFVTNPKELRQAFKDKKIGSMIGVESGHAIDSSLSLLRVLFDLGARYMTLTHSCNTPWADAAQVESEDEDERLPVRNNGLTSFGQKVVGEMNRMGMLVDLAHVSHKTMADVLDVAKAPVIFSHSSSKAVYNHVRNVNDKILRRVPENGGVVMVNFFDCYVGGCGNSTVDDVAKHVDHIKAVSGVDHVGLGSDYDGVPSLPEGLKDVSKFPNLLAALYQDYNWTPEDLGKLTSGNLLRVWTQAEEVANKLQSNLIQADDSLLPESDTQPNDLTCSSASD